MRFGRRGDRRRPARQALTVLAGAGVRPSTWVRAWPLMIAGLVVQLGAAAGNPWGLGDDGRPGAAAGPDNVYYPGVPVRPAPDSEWNNDRPRTWDADASSIEDGRRYGSQSPDRSSTRLRNAPPAADGDWGARRQQEEYSDPGFQFRADPQDGRRAGPDDAVDAADDAGYRFRGDPPNAGGGWRTQAPDGRYQFRPLSEQERGRQEQSQGWRPAPTGRGQGRSPGPASADTTPGLAPPWQSR